MVSAERSERKVVAMAESPDGVSSVAPALKLGDRFGKRLDGGRAEPSIGEFLIIGLERRRSRKQDRRAAIDRRIDEAVEMPWVAPSVRQPRAWFLIWGPLAHRLSAQGRGGHGHGLARLDGELLIRSPLRPAPVIDRRPPMPDFGQR
jgi:hypothetical protein